MSSIDLKAYFKRIGWRKEAPPTLETLSGLLAAHIRSIPFESLDVLLGRPIRLDLDSLQAKLVSGGRGGYCFEHATLFYAVLTELGFHPQRHSARVVLFAPRTEVTRAHVFLTVTIREGRFVVDPGLGGAAAMFPVPVSESKPQNQTHWLARDGDYWVMRNLQEGKSVDTWVSTLECDNPIDFEMANYFTSTHPNSPFLNRLMMHAFTAEGRVSLMNRDFSIRGGEVLLSGKLGDRAELRSFIAEHFGFDFPEVDRLRLPFIPEWN
jgi:N-hydroxyarylamine O-acetyltransferase